MSRETLDGVSESSALIAGPRAAPTSHALELAAGHRLLVERSAEASSLRLVGANGNVSLTISISAAGSVVRLEGHVALEASGSLELVAQRVTVRARDGIALETGGDLELHALGDVRSRGRTQSLQATGGDVALEADADVRVQGENVRLNC